MSSASPVFTTTRRARARSALVLLALATGAVACAPRRVTVAAEPARADSSGPARENARLAEKALMVPVEGIDPARVPDTYEARRGARTHDALDILAPRGTPVLAADAGRIFRLRRNEAGGITIYQFDPAEEFVYYYAHLERYREGLREGMAVTQGDVIGYVGTTGNAPPDLPHLHFQVMRYRGDGRYWDGRPMNPHAFLVKPGRAR